MTVQLFEWRLNAAQMAFEDCLPHPSPWRGRSAGPFCLMFVRLGIGFHLSKVFLLRDNEANELSVYPHLFFFYLIPLLLPAHLLTLLPSGCCLFFLMPICSL